MSDAEPLPVVYVRAMVNVNHLRRGDEGEVELTPAIERLVRSGYVRILGHVLPDPPSPPVADPLPVANPARTRRRAVSDAAGGDPA